MPLPGRLAVLDKRHLRSEKWCFECFLRFPWAIRAGSRPSAPSPWRDAMSAIPMPLAALGPIELQVQGVMLQPASPWFPASGLLTSHRATVTVH